MVSEPQTKAFQAISSEVQSLVDAAFVEVESSPLRGSALDQEGLTNGSEIAIGYLGHGETGLAFDHLRYMIVEPPVQVSVDCFRRIEELAQSLAIPEEFWASADPVLLFGDFPAGWTADRVRERCGGSGPVKLLPTRTPVFESGVADILKLDPLVIVDVGGMKLVLDRTDEHWHMGQLDGDAVHCWGSYGTDRGVAIDSL